MANLWTLAQVFHRSAREHPGHTMVVAGGNKQSYAQVDARSSALAAAMSELGLGAGDRVAIILPNRSEWIVALVACAKLGATVVPVNPRLNYHKLKYQLRHAEVSAAFTAEQYDGIHFRQYFEDVIVELPDLQYLVTVGEEELWSDDRIFRFEDLVSSGEGHRFPEPSLAGEDSDLARLYASGTMGKPNARDALRLLGAERITILSGVPTMFHLLSEMPRSIRHAFAVSAAASSPAARSPRTWFAAFANSATSRLRTASRRPDRRWRSHAPATRTTSARRLSVVRCRAST